MSEATGTAVISEPITPFADIEEPQAIVEQPAELAIQCVVYVGDILTTKQKKSPAYRLGGKLFPMPEFLTVPRSIVQRCAITRLRSWFLGTHKNMIDKEKWDGYVAAYTLKNQWDPGSGTFKDITVGKDGASVNLLYKKFRPIMELGRIAGVQNGVVALGTECGINTATDIKEAQFHYFPNWLEIVAQQATLPERLRDLQDHIENRREQTQDESLRAIGDAYLLSCSDYYDWGSAYVTFQSQVIKETEKFPGGARYDEIGERLFVTLGLTREDKMVQDFAKNQQDTATTNAKLTDAIAVMAEVVKTNQAILMHGGGQAPAPATIEEAAAEVERSIVEDVEANVEIAEAEIEPEFHDMSAAIIEPDALDAPVAEIADEEVASSPEEDAETAKYLAEAGVNVEEAEE